jgi:hypothetical protein
MCAAKPDDLANVSFDGRNLYIRRLGSPVAWGHAIAVQIAIPEGICESRKLPTSERPPSALPGLGAVRWYFLTILAADRPDFRGELADMLEARTAAVGAEGFSADDPAELVPGLIAKWLRDGAKLRVEKGEDDGEPFASLDDGGPGISDDVARAANAGIRHGREAERRDLALEAVARKTRAAAREGEKAHTFQREGKTWTLNFPGDKGDHLPHLDGFKVIAALLQYPNKQFATWSLFDIVNPPPPGKPSLAGIKGNAAGSAVELKTIEEQCYELAEEAKTAGEKRREAINDEIATLLERKRQIENKRGEPRSDESGGHRKAVARLLDRALKAIEGSEKLENMSRHLRAIKKDQGYLVYAPDGPAPSWEL